MSDQQLGSGAAGTISQPDSSAVRRKRSRGQLFARVPAQAMLLVFLLGLLGYFSATSPFFLSANNLRNILIAVSVLGILAAPSTMLLIAANVDLSVASVASFAGMALALASQGSGGSVALGIAAALATGLGVGVLNGFFVTKVGINSIIVTLGTLAVFRGATKLLSNGQTIRTAGYDFLGTGTLLGIPAPVLVFVAVAALLSLVLRYTVFGRSVYAIGSNPVAARLAGIQTARTLFSVFALTGLCAGLAGLVLTAQLKAASPIAGEGLELSVIAAVILGGASLTGGRGTITGTVLGILILGSLNNGLTILNVSAFWQEVARGAVLIAAVGFDQIRIRLGGR